MTRIEGARRREEETTSEILNPDPGGRRSYPNISMMPDFATTNGHSSRQGTSETGTNGIIGDSPALQSVLAEVGRVAPTESTVLVLGETGTGKELIARAIHNLSPRCHRPFLSLNCAAIPVDLLESELFGNEKGAFTGEVAKKNGRFEMTETETI